MKGLYFARPLEFRLETPAEQLRQGDAFSGTLTVTNRGPAASGLSAQVALGYSTFKRVKTNGAEAVDVSDQVVLAEDFALDAGAQRVFEWSFKLPPDAPVTSKEGALFLLYGQNVKGQTASGHIDLRVAPGMLISTLLAVVETRFSFAQRAAKFYKGFTEFKLDIPDNYATLEELVMAAREVPEGMELEFTAKAQAFEKGPSKGAVKIKTMKASRMIPRDQLMANPSTPNRALFQSTFQEVLEEFIPSLVK